MEPWNHIHTITRIPDNPKNGGDYGHFANAVNKNNPKTLLEHYKNADHHKANMLVVDYEVAYHQHHGKSHVH